MDPAAELLAMERGEGLASAASCAIDSCDATESRCVTKAIHVRAERGDHAGRLVVLRRRPDAVSLFLDLAPLRRRTEYDEARGDRTSPPAQRHAPHA